MEIYDICLVEFCFRENQTITKYRPALVINNNVLIDIAQITSHMPRVDTDYKIIKWKEAGLDKESTIRFGQIMTGVNVTDLKKIGHLDNIDIKNIENLFNINENMLDEDLEDAKSIIADQIRGEWEAIRNYQKAADDLKDLGDFDDVIDILNSINDEEEVHCGELEKAQSLIDDNLLDNIEDGRNEAEEDLAEKDFSLKEALNYSEQSAKMDAWHNGTRGANIVSMNNDKLEMNAQICKLKGYSYELSQLEAEARRRGIQLSTMGSTQPQQSSEIQLPDYQLPKLTWEDFHLAIASYIHSHRDEPHTIISDTIISKPAGISYSEEVLRSLCSKLVYAIALQYKDVVQEIKKFIIDSYNFEPTKFTEEFKQLYTDCLNDAEIRQRLVDAVHSFKESLSEAIENKQLDEIDKYLEDIYEMRRKGLAQDGQYGIENLVFKEIRNKGYLDNLKELKNQLVSKELSLESLEEDTVKNSKGKWVNKGEDGTHGEFKTKKAADAQRKAMFANGYHEELEERLDDKQRYNYRNELSRIAFAQPIIQDNGLFNIYNIKEDDADRIVRRIRNLDYIEWVQKTAGRYDFSHPQFMGPQKRYYNITGKIKEIN